MLGLTLSVLALAGQGNAQASASALSLNGVNRVSVRFVMTEDDLAAGVDTSRLLNRIADKLRARNISVVGGRGGEGTLAVNVGAMKSSGGGNVSFFYYLDFRQQVKVSRLPDPPFPPVPASTWTSPVSFGIERSDEILARLDVLTDELMDGFLRDHARGQDAVKR